MQRRLLGGVVFALLVVAVVMWRWKTHDTQRAGSPASAVTNTRQATAAKHATQSSRSEWLRDVDPEGELRIEGQVVDESGAGTAATVWLGSVPPRFVSTEADGTFAFDKVLPREYELSARSGNSVAGPVRYTPSAHGDPIVIRLVAGARVHVAVVGEDGMGVANATVKLDAGGDLSATTDATGSAVLAPVSPGWVGVTVDAAGYATGHAFSQIGSAGANATVRITMHRGIAVSGRVIAESGAGIANVRVTAGEAWWWMAAVIADATTDEHGNFTLTVAPGTHVLLASDGTHAKVRSAPIAVTDHDVTGVTLTMRDGGIVGGRVVDSNGHAIPFAEVRAAPVSGAAMAQGRQVVAEKDGTFELRGLSRTKVQVRAVSTDASSQLLDVDLSARPVQRDLRLVLDQTGTISGVVVDEHGAPVPEVQVSAGVDYLSDARASLAAVSNASTNGAGEFVIRGLPGGSYRLRASAGTSPTRDWETPGVVAKPGDTNVRVTLATPAVLVGKIALDSGAPPIDARVQVGFHLATPAASDGTFRVDSLTPGTYDVHVFGGQFAPLTRSDVKLEAGKTTDLGTLVAPRGRTLVGRVVDASGTPVAGARVAVSKSLVGMEGADDQMQALAELSGERDAVTDANGAFSIVGISKSAAYAGADHPERGRATPIAIPEGKDDPPAVTLALKPFGTIVGKVTSQGTPVGGATVTDTVQGTTGQTEIVRTADDGTFTFLHAVEGTHVLTAMQSQAMASKSASATAQVVTGATASVTIDIPLGSVALTVQVAAIAPAEVDAAQVFLMNGAITATTGKELTDHISAGGMAGMKFWFGAGKPMPEFDQVVPGEFTLCGIPITGDLSDSRFLQRIQQSLALLKVYCQRISITASPASQSAAMQLPAMDPLPAPGT
jgi:protocatechuate 3,4-dioxygenase beta subunit